MFTGLIESIGRIVHVEATGNGRLARVATPLGAELRPGDSVAVSGVCLTVTAAGVDEFSVEVSPETLRVTTWSRLAPGALVNLERPIRADGRLGGHFVLGHVDGVGRVAAIRRDHECHWLDIDIPSHVTAYVVPKGSIAIDGISLTIANVEDSRLGLQILPFTWAHTALQEARVGDSMNVEADVIGKYVARFVGRAGEPAGQIPEVVRGRS